MKTISAWLVLVGSVIPMGTVYALRRSLRLRILGTVIVLRTVSIVLSSMLRTVFVLRIILAYSDVLYLWAITKL